MRADAGIAEAANQIRKRLPIADEGSQFAWLFWNEDRSELGQHPVRQSGILMMHAVIRFVQQRVSKDMTEPAFRHDAASGAVYGVSHQSEMLDVLPPGLEISRDHRRHEVEPNEICPNAPKRDGRDNGRPRDGGQRQLQPNSPSHFSASDYRMWVNKNAQEDQRRIKQADS